MMMTRYCNYDTKTVCMWFDRGHGMFIYVKFICAAFEVFLCALHVRSFSLCFVLFRGAWKRRCRMAKNWIQYSQASRCTFWVFGFVLLCVRAHQLLPINYKKPSTESFVCHFFLSFDKSQIFGLRSPQFSCCTAAAGQKPVAPAGTQNRKFLLFCRLVMLQYNITKTMLFQPPYFTIFHQDSEAQNHFLENTSSLGKMMLVTLRNLGNYTTARAGRGGSHSQTLGPNVDLITQKAIFGVFNAQLRGTTHENLGTSASCREGVALGKGCATLGKPPHHT